MTEAEIFEEITAIVRDVLMRSDIELTPETTARDVPGWDSFKMLEIIISAEERFGIQMHTSDLDRLKNVGDLAQSLRGKIAARAGGDAAPKAVDDAH